MEIYYAVDRQLHNSGDNNKSFGKRKYLAISAVICFFFSLTPYLLYDIANEGSLCILLLGIFLSICTMTYPSDDAGHIQRSTWKFLKILLQMFIIGEVILCGIMLSTVLLRPTVGDAKTVVVLGCRTIDGKPSNMLRGRLESALNYLERSPTSNVVVSGYVSTGDTITQAEVMKNWLIENGISSDRIFMETRAIDTATNLKNTAKLIAENHLPNDIAIATDAYHIPRAVLYSSMYGFEGATTLPSMTEPLLLPIYWVREQLGIVEALLFK